jgi:hypothetical protein
MFLKRMLKNIFKHKKMVVISAIVVIFILPVLAAPFFTAFMPIKICDYIYRQMTYKFISYSVANNLEDDEDKLRALFNYVKLNESTESSYMVVDEPSLNSMVMGIGWCDQEAQLLGILLNECNIKSRLRDVQSHTSLEVFLDGKWRVVDPFFGELFYTEDDKIATLEEIVEGYGKNVFNKRFESMLVLNEFNILPERLYMSNEVRWKEGIGPEYHKSKSLIRNITDKFVGVWFSIYGKPYVYWFQDKYLNRYRTSDLGPCYIYNYSTLYKNNDSSFETYFKARNYHLYGRYGKAMELYDTIENKHADSFWAKESRYYTGILYFDKKNYIKAGQIFESIPDLNQDKYNRALLINGLVSARDVFNLNRLKMISVNEKTDIVN